MTNAVVRISEIELKGFKNIQHGLIQMPSLVEKEYFQDNSEILGIYGQNGSGKTAIMEAMNLIQLLLRGQSLPPNCFHYIYKGETNFIITVKMTIQTPQKAVLVEYSVEVTAIEQTCEITHETLSAAVWNGEKFEVKKTLIDYEPYSQRTVFTPKYRFEDLVRNNNDNKINLNVAKKIAQKDKCSFIFGIEGRRLFLSAAETVTEEYAYIIQALFDYASCYLFSVGNSQINTAHRTLLLPIKAENLTVHLDSPFYLTKEDFILLDSLLKEMNFVVNTIIPELQLELYNYGELLLENGLEGYKIELLSKRGEVKIPLRYESEGIVKLIAILNLLMFAYNNATVCLLIDELDAGIYEYLLGEIISVFQKNAKGQLIFTSHNLRALEMLNKQNIIFSTTNQNNKYIRLQKDRKSVG